MSLLRSPKAAVCAIGNALTRALKQPVSALDWSLHTSLRDTYTLANRLSISETQTPRCQSPITKLSARRTKLNLSVVQHQQYPARLIALLTSQDKREREFQLYTLTALLSLPQLSDKTVLQALDTLTQADVLQVSTLANRLHQQVRAIQTNCNGNVYWHNWDFISR